MARPRNDQPSRRYKLTLNGDLGEALEEYARQVGKAPATVAALLVQQGIEQARDGDVDQVAERDRRIAELQVERDRLREQLHELRRKGPSKDEDEPPHYELPVAQLLGDEVWWDAWLPRLYELLGSRLPPASRAELVGPQDVPHDERGYVDLMAWLFPPLAHENGGTISWRSPDYGAWAKLLAPAGRPEPDQLLAHRWEPVVRHVAEALCAFEYTAQAIADPYTRMRLKDEIVGPWLRVLLAIVDQQTPPELPQRGAGAEPRELSGYGGFAGRRAD